MDIYNILYCVVRVFIVSGVWKHGHDHDHTQWFQRSRLSDCQYPEFASCLYLHTHTRRTRTLAAIFGGGDRSWKIEPGLVPQRVTAFWPGWSKMNKNRKYPPWETKCFWLLPYVFCSLASCSTQLEQPSSAGFCERFINWQWKMKFSAS